MWQHYFKTAWRNLRKQKWFSLINLGCLSIGITFSMLIGMYIINQLNVNKNLKDIDRQYVLKADWKDKNMGSDITTIPPLAKALKEEYPGLVENYYRYNPVTNVVSAGEIHFKEDIAIGDTTLVSMYGFPLLYGNKEKAFKDNSSAVITETFAMKMFGTKNALGKRLSVQSLVAGIHQDYIVTAVLKDIPYNSVLHLVGDSYDIYIPATNSHYYQIGDPSLDWNDVSGLCFIKLKPNVKPSDLTIPIKQLLFKYSSKFIQQNLSVYPASIKDFYLKDNNYAVEKMVRNLSLVVLFILLMVVINFININIGTSSHRLKEIGLRKTFGSGNKQIALHFLAETFMLTAIAAIISLFLYQSLSPVFSNILNIEYPGVWQFSVKEYSSLLLLVLLVGLLAGTYPAFILSRTNLVLAVKGKINSKRGSLVLRKLLLIIQFTVAIFIFIFALTISRQVSYIFNKNLGYNKDQLLIITAFPKQWDSAGVAKLETIKQNLLQSSSVKSATLSFDVPERIPYGRITLIPPASSDKQLNMPLSVADEDYAKTFEVPMLAGSFFNNDKNGIVLNETAVKSLGLTVENAVGKQLNITVKNPVTISGVMKDFNSSTMQDKIGPLCFIHMSQTNQYRFLTVKLSGNNIAATIDGIKTKWKSFNPNAPFDFTFMDEKFKAIYKSELQLKSAASIGTMLNLIIVFLGIIGVVAFTLAKRTKEVAIRKVLGANKRRILSLFLKDYFGLLLIANVIAWPLAYIISDYWLRQYAYHIQQNIIPYAVVCITIYLITIFLIFVQSYKLTRANPVRNLKTE